MISAEQNHEMTSLHGKAFHITGSLWGETTIPLWALHKKASDTGLDVFFDVSLNNLLNELPVISDAMTLIWCRCNV